jgi:hypothetical protein
MEYISSSGELEAIMAGIEDDDDSDFGYFNTGCDEDGDEIVVDEDGNEVIITSQES